jgi:hypothetical protein
MAYLTSKLHTLQLAAHAITLGCAGFTDCTLLITSLYYVQRAGIISNQVQCGALSSFL